MYQQAITMTSILKGLERCKWKSISREQAERLTPVLPRGGATILIHKIVRHNKHIVKVYMGLDERGGYRLWKYEPFCSRCNAH